MRNRVLSRGLRAFLFLGKWGLLYALLPGALLAALEWGLRATQVGQPCGYLIQKDFDGAAYRLPNKRFFQRFSSLPIDSIADWDTMEFLAPVQKAPGAYRIFIFGESAAYGAPYAGYGFPRYLEAMLRARFPERNFEFYNTACPGINSYIVQAVAHACAALQPDLFLVYMGNNEGNPPFSPHSVFGRSAILSKPAVVRAWMELSGLRTAQAGVALLHKLHLDPESPALTWTQDPMNLDLIHARFETNLLDICAAGSAAGASVVVCTLGRNIAGFQKEEGIAAASAFTGVAINRLIREAAGRLKDKNVRLADIENTLRQNSPDGMPGDRFFEDRVHFTFEGNYLAARTMFEQIAPLLATAGAPPAAEALTEGQCEERLGLSPAARKRMRAMRRQTDGKAADPALQPAETDAERAEILDGFRRACSLAKDDCILHMLFVRALLDADLPQEALREAQALQRICPCHRAVHRLLGLALMRSADADGSRRELLEQLRRYPDDTLSEVRLKSLPPPP